MAAHSLMVAATSGTETALVVSSAAFGASPGFGCGRHVHFCSHVKEASEHILMASSPLPLPGIFAGASTSGASLYSRPGLARHFSWLLPPPSSQVDACVPLFLFPDPSFWARLGLASHFSRLPSPTLLSGLWLVSCLWAEKCCLRTFSVFCLLSLPLLHGTLRFCDSLLVWPVRRFPSAWKFFFLHYSLLPLEQPS